MIKHLYPLISADVALFSISDTSLQVLLVQRATPPHKGLWALPGAILKPDEDVDLEATARRALRSKLGVEVPYLKQERAFSGAERDPRDWSLSVLYWALLPRHQVHAVAGSRVKKFEWFNADAPGALAFDHAEQLGLARSALRERVKSHSPPLHPMEEKFTLRQLKTVCEKILRTNPDDEIVLDKGAFHRRFAKSPDLVAVLGDKEEGPRRPAQRYRASSTFRF